jgi:hypothetical protein
VLHLPGHQTNDREVKHDLKRKKGHKSSHFPQLHANMGNSSQSPTHHDATSLHDVIVSIRSTPPTSFILEKSLGRVVAYSKTYSRSSGRDDEHLEELTRDSRKLCLKLGGNCILGVQVQVEVAGGNSRKDRLRLVLTGDLYQARKASFPRDGVLTRSADPLKHSSAVHIINGKRKGQELRQSVADSLQGIEGGLSFIP